MAYTQCKTVVCSPIGGSPEEQGKGIARSLMDFGEQLARENECLSVRLDTFSKTLETTAFTTRKYQRVGEVFAQESSSVLLL